MTKAMIVSVGGTAAPIIKSICEYKPEFVSFFASQDTVDTIAEIKREVKQNNIAFKNELTLADDVNDLLHCHEKAEEAIKRVVDKHYPKSDVIVDYTGGTKNMSVALALASILHGYSFSYVGGQVRTKNGRGVPINGTEQIYPSINPWDFLAIEERRKISLLFNQFQFKASKELAGRLFEKVVIERTLLKAIATIIEGYYEWDMFRHKGALKKFKEVDLDELSLNKNEGIVFFAKETKNQISFLELLLQESNEGKKPSRKLMIDLYANAQRRYKEGKIDDAVVRIYRLVEMAGQERLLNKYSIDASNVKPDKIPDSLRQDYIHQYTSKKDKKIKIPQNAVFELLDALGDNMGRRFKNEKDKFLNVQSTRNYSYLAHGFESVREKTYESLREFVTGLLCFRNDEIITFPQVWL